MTACRAAATGASSADGSLGIAAGDVRSPALQPVSQHRGPVRLADPIEEPRHVEQGMTDPAIAPVEEHETAVDAADVARMAVAVHDPVAETAGPDAIEPGWKAVDERGERRLIIRGDLLSRPVDKPGDRRSQRGRSPVREPETEQLVRTPEPRLLDPNEDVDHRQERGSPGVVLVLARNAGEQDARTVVPDEARDGGAGQSFEDRALMGEERRDDLQPCIPVVGRQVPQAREVPGADLVGRSGQGDTVVGEDARRPGEVRVRSARSRPRLAQRVLGEGAGPGPEGPIGYERIDVAVELGEVRDGAAMG